MSVSVDTPAVAIVERLLKTARERGASDLHLDPSEDGVRVRMRRDGALQTIDVLPTELSPQIVGRCKALAELQASEGGIEHARHRLRTDGSYRGEVLRIGTAEVTVAVQAAAGDGCWSVHSTARCSQRGELGLGVQCKIAVDLLGRKGLPVVRNWRQLR